MERLSGIARVRTSQLADPKEAPRAGSLPARSANQENNAEAEKNAINDALGGFDNYALGYRVPNR